VRNGVSKRTQEKLDALARRLLELHEKVKAGEMSCHAAAVGCGPRRLAAALGLRQGFLYPGSSGRQPA
jgi:hypothetical protein